MSLKEKYSCLKQAICEQARRRPYSFQKVKDFYKASINSNRSLSKVKDLKCIFKLLEERCLLDERNVTALYCLGELLDNPDITEWIDVYTSYSSEPETTCICGMSCDFRETYNSNDQESEVSDQVNTNSDSTDELGEKLRNLSIRIGNNWKVLARQLELKEKYIDDICKRFPNNPLCQAKAAFEILCSSSDANISVSVLETALESRYCRLKGLSSCLLEPLISLPC